MKEELVHIAFPGLGIEEFTLNKIAFSLFGKIDVRWYGLIITCGIVLAFAYATWRGKRNEHIIMDDIIDVGLVAVLLGILGARLYYVITDSKGSYDSFLDVIAIWNGGLAIYGGIIGGALGIFIMCRVKKLNLYRFMDMVAPGVMIAQALGRWGNFFNGEAYGYRITDTTQYYFFNKEHTLPAGEGTLFHLLRMELHPNLYSGQTAYAFHPTFLYESLWNILGFVLINVFYRKKKFDGQIVLMYLTWYGFGRMFIEGLRTDSLFLGNSGLRISQCLGLLCFLGGAIALTVFLIRAYKRPVLAEGEVPAEEPTTDIEPAEELGESHTETQEDTQNGNEN